HQHRPAQLLDRPPHHVGLAAAGHAHQDLLPQPGPNALHNLLDRLRLVASGLERRVDLECGGHRAQVILWRTDVRRNTLYGRERMIASTRAPAGIPTSPGGTRTSA